MGIICLSQTPCGYCREGLKCHLTSINSISFLKGLPQNRSDDFSPDELYILVIEDFSLRNNMANKVLSCIINESLGKQCTISICTAQLLKQKKCNHGGLNVHKMYYKSQLQSHRTDSLTDQQVCHGMPCRLKRSLVQSLSGFLHTQVLYKCNILPHGNG